MYSIVKHIHSGVRWLVLLAIIWAITDAYTKWKKQTPFTKESRLPAFIAFNFCHIQLLVGLFIYFLTPRIIQGGSMMKDKIMRFFAVEHPTLMILGIAVVTIGYIRAKKNTSGIPFRIIFWYYLIALALILFGIPWPFQQYATAWF